MRRVEGLRSRLPLAFVLLSVLPTYYYAYQWSGQRHYGIGRWDSDYIASVADFYPPVRMEGPIRHADGTVEVQSFVGRLTRKHATFALPYHAFDSPLELRVRCHRFGLQGEVQLVVNSEPIDTFVFSPGSYPWGGIHAVIPQRVAEAGPLLVELTVDNGKSPPSHLPEDLGVGIDWLETTPMSQGVRMRPVTAEWVRLVLVFLAASIFARFMGASASQTAIVLAFLLACVGCGTALLPELSSRVLVLACAAFPLLLCAIWGAERIETWFPVRGS